MSSTLLKLMTPPIRARTVTCLTLAVACSVCSVSARAGLAAEVETIEQDRFEKEVVASGCNDAVQMDISSDGRLVFIERTGAVKLLKMRQRQVVLLAKIPAAYY